MPRTMTAERGNRKLAELFELVIFDLVVTAGGERSTAHYCVAEWAKAIERGDFG